LFKKYKLDPIAFEARYTVFDYQFFINSLVDEIEEERKEREKNDGDKFIKLLRILKNMLNRYEF